MRWTLRRGRADADAELACPVDIRVALTSGRTVPLDVRYRGSRRGVHSWVVVPPHLPAMKTTVANTVVSGESQLIIVYRKDPL